MLKSELFKLVDDNGSYLRGNIMRRAWSLYRNQWSVTHRASFGEMLKKAWNEARVARRNQVQERQEQQERADNIAKAVAQFEAGADYVQYGKQEYTFSRWTKYGKDRLYINTARGIGCGYIDMADGANCSDLPNDLAAALYAKCEH